MQVSRLSRQPTGHWQKKPMAEMVSLFDYSTIMAKPWAEAGYITRCYDLRHPGGYQEGPWEKGQILKTRVDVLDLLGLVGTVAFVAAFPPCTDVSVSGSRWFRSKGLKALIQALTLFDKAVELCEGSGAPYMIENPVSTVATYYRKPDYIFHPYQYAGYEGGQDDHYSKRTCLWTGGGFVMPNTKPRKDFELVAPDDRIHKAGPGLARARFRSATPPGFARAVFEANHALVKQARVG